MSLVEDVLIWLAEAWDGLGRCLLRTDLDSLLNDGIPGLVVAMIVGLVIPATATLARWIGSRTGRSARRRGPDPVGHLGRAS